MDWWHKMVFPVRRAWFSVSTRVRNRKNGPWFCDGCGAGLLKLHNDIQSCGYEDVQIMWEMLRRTESQVMSRHGKHKRWFWRNFSWSNTNSNHGAGVSFSSNQT